MKLQGKKTGAFAGFIGYIDQDTASIVDLATENTLLTVQYKDAGIKCYRHYKTIAEFNADWEDYTPEPDPSFLIVKIEKLENSVKTLDERLKAQTEKMGTLRDGINELHNRLKTVEEIAELRTKRRQNDHRQSQTFKPGIPPREKFERMKQDLRDWIEKNEVKSIQTFIQTEPDGRRGVLFRDATNKGDNTMIIIGWPSIGLVDGAAYTPDELLITGEAGKE